MGTPSPAAPEPPAAGRRPVLILTIGAIAMVLTFSAAFVVAVTRLSDENEALRNRVRTLEKGSSAKSVRIEDLIEENEEVQGWYRDCREAAEVFERSEAGVETLMESSNEIQIFRGISRLISLRKDLKRAAAACLEHD